MQRNFLWRKESSGINIDVFSVRGYSAHKPESVTAAIEYCLDRPTDKNHFKNTRLSNEARNKGNIQLQRRQYFEALQCYTTSIILAENDTIMLPMAYADRARCFFRMGMHIECLGDIENAKKANYPSQLLEKLETQRIDCIKSMEEEMLKPKVIKYREPTLSFDEHPEYAGVANCLKIQNGIKFGRHVVATSDFQIGQTILVEEPFAIAQSRNRELTGRRCMYCFVEDGNFITCDKCVSGLFCDEVCMEMSFHKYDCNMPDTLSRKETFELVLKMFYKIDSILPDVDVLMQIVESLLEGDENIAELTTEEQKDFAVLFQLAHNHEKKNDYQLLRLVAASDVAIRVLMRNPAYKDKYSSEKHQRFLQHLILHLFHIAEHSIGLMGFGREMEDETMRQARVYANAIYPFGCFVSHSCVPNVAWYSVDRRLVLKVIQPIKKGEQIFRSYKLNIMNSFFRRTEKLFPDEKYHFKCNCCLCKHPNKIRGGPASNEINDAARDILDIAQLPNVHTRSLEDLEKTHTDIIKVLEDSMRFHPCYNTFKLQYYLQNISQLIAAPIRL